jgi:erythronate-4-phosphate dehydrogenase
MRFVVDRNTPFIEDAFSTLGEVVAVDTSEFIPERIRNADALIVRSEVKVGERLLGGSKVRFVGSTTIGTDHLDLPWLASRGIRVASAPGSNANSVREYILAALLVLADRMDFRLHEQTIGIVGVGNVGSLVRKTAQTLGMKVILNDPPLARATGDPVYRSLEEALTSDIVTLHVPLTKGGDDPTYHLIGGPQLEAMAGESILLNTSRGAVVDNQALKHVLGRGRLRAAVLDVWEGEPLIDGGLLNRTALGTPHIAGYSLDGKTNAVRTVYRAACAFLNAEPTWDVRPEKLPPPPVSTLGLGEKSVGERELGMLVRQCYDILSDDRALRALSNVREEERGALFQRLRTGYRIRREFSATRITGASPDAAAFLQALGFTI